MIPLYYKKDTGTDYQVCYELNQLALYLVACGWRVGLCVYPSNMEV